MSCLRIIIVHKPPYSQKHLVTKSTFLNEFSSYLETILISREPLIITGDFNIHIDPMGHNISWNYLIQHLSSNTSTNPPMKKATLLISSSPVLLTEYSYQKPAADELFSNDLSISCSLSLLKPQLSVKEVSIRPKSINLPSFLGDLAASELCTNPPKM